MELLVQIPERCQQLQNWKAISSVGRWQWLEFQRLLQRDPIVTALECPAHTSLLSTLPLSLNASSSASTFNCLLATSLLPRFPVMAFAYFLLSLCSFAPVPLYCMPLLSVSLTQTPQERACVVVQSPLGSRQRIPMKQQASEVAAQTTNGWLCVSCPSSCLLGASLPKKHLKWLWIQQDCFHSMSSTRLIS